MANIHKQSVCAHPRTDAAARESLRRDAIAPSGSRRLRPTLVAAPILFAHSAVTVSKHGTSATPIRNLESCYKYTVL